MKLEEMKVGKKLKVKLKERVSEEIRVFEGMKGAMYSFIKEQDDGEYIISFRTHKQAISLKNGDAIEFSEKSNQLVVYKPHDCEYESAKTLLIKSHLWGRNKKWQQAIGEKYWNN